MNPLTRPAPAEENAGGGPPSPPKGRGQDLQGDLFAIRPTLSPKGERGRGVGAVAQTSAFEVRDS